MLDGMLIATSNPDEVRGYAESGCLILYIGDPIYDEQEKDIPMANATPLVPDWETLAVQEDGDINTFTQMYSMTLQKPPAIEFFGAILAGLMRSKTIILYFPKDTTGMLYPEFLLSYIQSNFGITTQTKSSPYLFNPIFVDYDIAFLYKLGMATPQEFVYYANQLDLECIEKIKQDIRPHVQDPTNVQSYVDWIEKYKQELIGAGQPLLCPFQYFPEENNCNCGHC